MVEHQWASHKQSLSGSSGTWAANHGPGATIKISHRRRSLIVEHLNSQRWVPIYPGLHFLPHNLSSAA